MTDDQHGEGTPQGGGRWDPLPQGDYDDGATAFVKLPEGGIDALLNADSPLAAPGHGYVPPRITAVPGAGDPAAPGAWSTPAGGAQWPDPNATPAQPQAADDRFTYDPGTTQQWTFEEPAAPAAPGHDVTGQWSIPVAGGDLPDESGEFTTSALAEQWGSAPATLPGGAPAPWATNGTGTTWSQPPAAPAPEPYAPDAPYGHPPTDFQEQGPSETGHGEQPGFAGGEGQGHAGAGHAEERADAGQVEQPRRAGEGHGETGGRPDGHAPVGFPEPGPEAAGHGEADARPEFGHDMASRAEDGHPEFDHRGVRPAQDGHSESGRAEFAHDGVAHAEAGPGEGYRGGDLAEAGRAEAADRADAPATAEAHAPADPHGPAEAHAPADAQASQDAHARADVSAPADTAPDSPAPTAVPGHPPADGPMGEATEPAADTAAEHPGEAAADDAEPGADEPPAAPLTPNDDHPLASYVLRVNGVDRPVTDAWIGESLLYVLRERLGLAGAKDGCSQGECGACNVQVDGRLVASCLVPAVTAAGSEVRTVEGLAADGRPSDVQRALARCGAVQCGFCVPGMAMTVHDLLEGNPAPTDLETRQALCGNLCRCSGYRGVLEAVRDVVAEREAGHAGDAEPDADQARIPHQAGPGSGGVNPSAFEAPGAFDTPDGYGAPDPYGTPNPYDQNPQGPHYGQDGGQA